MKYETRIDIAPEQRSTLIAILNQSLADTIDLKSQAKQAHWNVKGLNFLSLHELFDRVADQMDDYGDTLAERITALGGYALGTVRMSAQASSISELPLDIKDGKDYVIALADRLAVYGKSLRADIDKTANLGDAVTADLYTGIACAVDKLLWLVEAHLQ